MQSHERIPGCDVYRAGDGVHRRWLELRARVAGMIERLGMAISPYHRYVCAAERRLSLALRDPGMAEGGTAIAV